MVETGSKGPFQDRISKHGPLIFYNIAKGILQVGVARNSVLLIDLAVSA
jgi:hypothetical protein